jgi:hypothetical protein
MALNPKAWLDTARTLDRLVNMEVDHRKLIEKLADEIQEMKDRLTKLEAHVDAREEILVAEAKGAAAAVASATASQHIAQLAPELGKMQGRLEASAGRLPPP